MGIVSPPFRVGQTFTSWRDIPFEGAACVYCLVDPRHPNMARYLGSTVQPRQRLKSHEKARVSNPRLQAWRDRLRSDGLAPAMRIVAVLPTERACRSAEWKIAARWERRGVTLLGVHVPPTCDTALYFAGKGWPGALATVSETKRSA